MTKKHLLHSAVLVCLLAPLGGWAQTAGESPALLDWSAANDAVAEFKRGHIDLLKWEAANVSKEAMSPALEPNLLLMTQADLVRKAWAVHPDLARVQSRLGVVTTQQIADGQLDAVDPSLQRRIEDMDELLEVATEARKAWITAVSARQVVRFREAAVTSAEAGEELGRRMVSVGNWSPLQHAPLRLAKSSARGELIRAKLDATLAEGAVIRLLRLSGTAVVLGLPSALPELPATAMERQTWMAHQQAVQAQLPDLEAARNRFASGTAFEIHSASFALAQTMRDDVLAVRRFVAEETVLHYNGMLKSVWDLLSEVSNQTMAEADTIASLRDFWLANADLLWTLQGGLPTSFVSLGAGSADAAGAAAH